LRPFSMRCPAESARRPTQQIRFTKLPLRSRAGSSPLRGTNFLDGPAVLVTSPSRPTEASHLRRGSLGTVESTRPRRDTTTTTASSELSSENEFDSAFFHRKPLSSRRARASHLLSERIQEDEREGHQSMDEVDDASNDSDSTLSSAFVGSADSVSILGLHNGISDSLGSKLPGLGRPGTPQRSSPKKQRAAPTPLQKLSGPRPVSMMAPKSLLSQALRGRSKAPETDPFVKFSTLSATKSAPGKDLRPLYVKIYAPSSNSSNKPFELTLLRTNEAKAVTVAEAIGFALYRYNEEKLEPRIVGEQANVNRWNFRMVDDGEVEYDFPPLGRLSAMSDFTSNNNRGARGRSREKPWDEFALVEASEKEFKENEAATPQDSKDTSTSAQETLAAPLPPLPAPSFTTQASVVSPSPTPTPYRNPITGPAFPSSSVIMNRKDSTPLDAPAPTMPRATPRTGLPKTLKIRFADENAVTRTTLIEATTDTYLAEVFDQACNRLHVEKALYVLKVSGTNTIVPHDRTVEALGDRTDLDIQRRRFIGDVFSLSGSPGSSSPNAPLLIAPGGTPKKGKSKLANAAFAPQNRDAALSSVNSAANYKRYNVIRKQPMSFSSSSARIILLDAEFMHIMPSEGPKAMWEMTQGKVTTIPFSSVVGCKVSRKHPRMFCVTVFKERESKRYDFETSSPDEATEIVEEIRRGMEISKPERLLEFGF
jgi:target of rapamycin complex 2 subunit MAPKAP1